ncbi:hypothetical protein DNTS_009881 [Danionella cerebrum]|uniref:NAD(P)(+)--arginine ADP-ribosyltransferase n=1 Tax=Danionella cerebrum TaxID=2873325 RepID=A0A553NJP5_9TELE|nr:hypothetical protein DNTS_009881 [Danionella translucida]
MGRPLLLLVLTAAVQVAAAIRMGMFPEVVDYSFTDCRQEMLEMVTTGGLLEKELDEAGKANFKKLWQGNVCDHLIPGGTAEHVTALQSFAVNENFQKAFNKALNNAIGVSTYQDRFPFKSMFFLISDAMELLKPENCSTVYSGTEMEYEANIGETVRLKTFFPAKMELADVTEDAELSEEMGTVFMITSCSAISLEVALKELKNLKDHPPVSWVSVQI